MGLSLLLRTARTGNAGLGHIEIQVRPNQVRSQFWVLYLVRRAKIWGSSGQKILFLIVKILFVVLLDTDFVSGSGSPIHFFCIGPNPEEMATRQQEMQHWVPYKVH